MSYPYKRNRKNKNKHFNSNAHEEIIHSKERKFIRLICEFEWMRIAKSKKRSNRISFCMILVKLFHRKSSINFIQKIFMEKWVWNPSAVRGYHYYRNYWQPVVGEELDCMQERYNPFDLFALAIKKTTRATVRYLPMENSRATKYLMDRRARFTVFLTSSQYCVSPLV